MPIVPSLKVLCSWNRIQFHIKTHSAFTGCLCSQGDVVTAGSGAKRAVQSAVYRELSTLLCSQEFTAAYAEGRGRFLVAADEQFAIAGKVLQ